MGNVGQHYYAWRTQPPPPPPPPPPPLPTRRSSPSGPQRTDLTATSATIEWQTNEPTTSFVDWDTDSSRDPYRNRSGSGGFRTTHSVTLTGLAPDTVYFWRVASTDQDGQSVPENNHSFRTLPASGGGTTINTPTSGQRVTNPLTVSGQEDGTAFEASVVVRLRDPRNGFIFAEQATTVQGGGVGRPGPYSVTLHFTPPATDQPGAVEVVSSRPGRRAGATQGQRQRHGRRLRRADADADADAAAGADADPAAGTDADADGDPPPPPTAAATRSRGRAINQRVGTPLRVLGTVDSTVVGGNIVVQIRDRNTNQVVASQPGTANARGEFDVLIDYPLPAQNTPGVVEVVAPQTTTGGPTS